MAFKKQMNQIKQSKITKKLPIFYLPKIMISFTLDIIKIFTINHRAISLLLKIKSIIIMVDVSLESGEFFLLAIPVQNKTKMKIQKSKNF